MIMNKSKRLTLKQKKFCLGYMETGNASKAARDAGYSAKTAHSIGFENLTKPEIQNRLKELKDNLAETAGITPVMIALELKKMAFSNVSDTRIDWMTLKDFNELDETVKACISEVTHSIIGAGENKKEMVRVRFHDKNKAIDSLVKLLGYNTPEKHEHTGKDGTPIKTEITHTVTFLDYSSK